MKEEQVAADFGTKRHVARWKEDMVRSTYKRLEELRKKDPKIPQKLVYPEAEVSKRPSKLQIRRTTAPTSAAIYKRRSRKKLVLHLHFPMKFMLGCYTVIVPRNCGMHLRNNSWELKK
ncbi:hypothetical protein Hanom_Chr16g01464601 [Helianthus anomalus]